jgi:hypothetical protein
MRYLQCPQEETDSLIWQTAMLFTTYFNKRDTASMNRFLPDDFMLHLLHDNFLGKKSLLNTMMDTAVQLTFQHYLKRSALALIRYSDDNNSASLDVSIGFMDPHMAESVKKERGYGLCIMFFQKINGRWWLKTVHLDLHCSLCNE